LATAPGRRAGRPDLGQGSRYASVGDAALCGILSGRYAVRRHIRFRRIPGN